LRASRSHTQHNLNRRIIVCIGVTVTATGMCTSAHVHTRTYCQSKQGVTNLHFVSQTKLENPIIKMHS